MFIIILLALISAVVLVTSLASKSKQKKDAAPIRHEVEQLKPLRSTSPIRQSSTASKPATPKPAQTGPKKVSFNVTGTSHYQDAFRQLLVHNDDYDLDNEDLECGLDLYEREWKDVVTFSKVELVPEPENEHDSNAVRVELDGILVGYIKAGSCSRVKNLLKSDKYIRTTAETYGGPYKTLVETEDSRGDYREKVEKRDGGQYGVKVTIECRE